MNNIMGWVCPKCGRIYSPFMSECKECNIEYKTQQTTPMETKNSDVEMPAEILSEWLNGPKESGE